VVNQIRVALRLGRSAPRLGFGLLQRRLRLPELQAGIAIVETDEHVARLYHVADVHRRRDHLAGDGRSDRRRLVRDECTRGAHDSWHVAALRGRGTNRDRRHLGSGTRCFD